MHPKDTDSRGQFCPLSSTTVIKKGRRESRDGGSGKGMSQRKWEQAQTKCRWLEQNLSDCKLQTGKRILCFLGPPSCSPPSHPEGTPPGSCASTRKEGQGRSSGMGLDLSWDWRSSQGICSFWRLCGEPPMSCTLVSSATRGDDFSLIGRCGTWRVTTVHSIRPCLLYSKHTDVSDCVRAGSRRSLLKDKLLFLLKLGKNKTNKNCVRKSKQPCQPNNCAQEWTQKAKLREANVWPLRGPLHISASLFVSNSA